MSYTTTREYVDTAVVTGPGDPGTLSELGRAASSAPTVPVTAVATARASDASAT